MNAESERVLAEFEALADLAEELASQGKPSIHDDIHRMYAKRIRTRVTRLRTRITASAMPATTTPAAPVKPRTQQGGSEGDE